MYPRGTKVDEDYRYDGWKENGYEGLDPEKRKVTQNDIDMLGLDKMQFDENGKANLGNTTNKYHNSATKRLVKVPLSGKY
jgi:hypothetical protein